MELGFKLVATEGTAKLLNGLGIPAVEVKKLHEGRPNLGDMICNQEIDLVINTPIGREGKIDDSYIRMTSIRHKVPYMTTMAAAKATIAGIRAAQAGKVTPKCLQEYHG